MLKLQLVNEVSVFSVGQIVLDIHLLSRRICQPSLVLSAHDLADNKEHNQDGSIGNTVDDHASFVARELLFKHNQRTSKVTQGVKDHIHGIVKDLFCVASDIGTCNSKKDDSY